MITVPAAVTSMGNNANERFTFMLSSSTHIYIYILLMLRPPANLNVAFFDINSSSSFVVLQLVPSEAPGCGGRAKDQEK